MKGQYVSPDSRMLELLIEGVMANSNVPYEYSISVEAEVYTASNGNSIFLPLAGGVYGSTPKQQGISGTYWTSTFERNGALGPGAYSFYVQYRETPQAPSVGDIIAYNGLPIRPVFCVE